MNPNPFQQPTPPPLPGFPGAGAPAAAPNPYAPQPAAAAPQGYPGPAVPMPVAGQPAPNPYAQPPAQAFGNPMDVGAAIAGATLGVTRYPPLTVGNYLLRIELTKKPERSNGFVVELTVVESSGEYAQPSGTRCSFYQNLSGPSSQALEAQRGSTLAFILRGAGFADLDAMNAAGWSKEQLANLINQCMFEPGPLSGRPIRCSVVDSGKRTKPKADGTGGGFVIHNHNWAPAA